MLTRRSLTQRLLVALAGLCLLAGCTQSTARPGPDLPNTAPPTSSPPAEPTSPPPTSPISTESPTPGPPTDQPIPPSTNGPGPEPPSPDVVYSATTHDYGVPTEESPFTTIKDVRPPVEPPPAPPLPCLREIGAGQHPDENPGYDQLSFRFSGGFPSYDIRYVSALLAPGSGEDVPVPGATSILQVEFRDAQAHDESGASCIRSSPENWIGFPVIAGFAQAGDFEGIVLFGIGIAVEPAPDGPGRVRIIEVERVEDGSHVYVVGIQVATE